MYCISSPFLFLITQNTFFLLFFTIDYSGNGAKSWFRLPGISFQPSELIKISLIILLSYIIKKSSNVNASIKGNLSLLMKMTITTMILIILIMQQPDLGTSLVLISIFCGLVFISGIAWKIISPV
ncbi:FtsW/RodA/SpoVE family cell cycle protein [Metabacillus sp. YM-086]|uniref:FtsW/RodA/SpoVE family cell cycle protein n=1 Tax=Metabacillus TaxID=2675233 RepID=UPI001B905FD2